MVPVLPTGRTQCVRHDGAVSASTDVVCGVPQGSVLGSILSILYTGDLLELIQRHNLSRHSYVDDSDTQDYGSCRPADIDVLLGRHSACIYAIGC